MVLGDQLGVSVGDLFLGSLIPGLLMAGAFALYVLVASQLNPQLAPERMNDLRPKWRRLSCCAC